MTVNTTIGERDSWEFRSSPNFNKIYVDGLTGTDGEIILNGASLTNLLTSQTDTIVQQSSGNWDGTYTNVQANSANWDGTYTTVLANSANWDSHTDLTSIAAASGNWDNTYTNVQANSGDWESTFTTVQTTSADWLAGTSRGVQVSVVEYSTDVTALSGQAYFHIDSIIDGMTLTNVHAQVITAGTTGTTDIQIVNTTTTNNMLSTVCTIDSGETGSDTAAIPAGINSLYSTVSANNLIRIDVDAISTIAPKGLIVTLNFNS